MYAIVEKKQPVTQSRSFKQLIRFVTLVSLLRSHSGRSHVTLLVPTQLLGLTMDNCGGQSYDGAGNMAGRYAGVLTIIQHQFPKFILLLDKFLLVETSHTNCWIHPCHEVSMAFAAK